MKSVSCARCLADLAPSASVRAPTGLPAECTLTLTEEERSAVAAVVAGLPPFPQVDWDDGRLFHRLELCLREMPITLASALIGFRRYSNDFGVIHIRNLPTDPTLPPTPSDGHPSPHKESWISEYSLLLCMMFLGEPLAYADEKEGLLIHNICPIEGQEHKQENTGTTYLEFHTENAFHPYKPDYLGLCCLRPDHDQVARTLAASVRRVIGSMPQNVLELLREPLYRFGTVPSFAGSNGAEPYSTVLPVLTGPWLDPDMCIDVHHVEPLGPAAAWALKTFVGALEASLVGIVLLPGDLLIIDNRVAAHARTGFRARHDGFDRWLQRLYVIEDFRRSRVSRALGKHVCAPLAFQSCRSGAPAP